MDDQTKVPLILFSGGLDSTYLLQEKLKESDVEILYVKGVLNEDKMAIEQQRREKIIELLEKETGNKVRKQHVIDLGPMPFGDMVDNAFVQPPMWMMGALMISNAHIHSELVIGYVLGDGALAVLSNIVEAWKHLQHICKRHEEPIAVNFPLKYLSKLHFLNTLHPEVMRHVWHCEWPVIKKYYFGPSTEPADPDKESFADRRLRHSSMLKKTRPCGNCEPCLTMAMALFKWKKINGYPYHRQLLRELRSYHYNKKVSEGIEKDQEMLSTVMESPTLIQHLPTTMTEIGGVVVVDYTDPNKPLQAEPIHPLFPTAMNFTAELTHSTDVLTHGDPASY